MVGFSCSTEGRKHAHESLVYEYSYYIHMILGVSDRLIIRLRVYVLITESVDGCTAVRDGSVKRTSQT